MNLKQLLRFEVMDRAAVQLECLQTSLSEHEGLTPATQEKLNVAMDAVYDLYRTAVHEFDRGEE